MPELLQAGEAAQSTVRPVRLDTGELLALDRQHVWHPYGPMPGRQEPLVVESAAGVRLRLAQPAEGHRELIDGMSSWWSAIHGYNNPTLVYTMPPYITTDDDLARICTAVRAAVEAG